MIISRRTAILGGVSAVVIGITGLVTGPNNDDDNLPEGVSMNVHHSLAIDSLPSENDSDVKSAKNGHYQVFRKLDPADELIEEEEAENFIQRMGEHSHLVIYQQTNYSSANVEVGDLKLDENEMTIFIKSTSTGEGGLSGSVHTLMILIDIKDGTPYEEIDIILEDS